MEKKASFRLSLFWRTYVLLAVLLLGGVLAWLGTLGLLERSSHASLAAEQTTVQVQLARATLASTDPAGRASLLQGMTQQGFLWLQAHAPSDVVLPYDTDAFSRQIVAELQRSVGEETIVARSVNNQPGLWVGFALGQNYYWLHTETPRQTKPHGWKWYGWVILAAVITALGSAGVAMLINQPLRDLSFAASRLREGEFDSRLDENTLTREVREVNKGFNRMARELAKVDEDRAVMLAGISHDLRTPLARLRLEAEMSVHDDEAKQNIAMDIDQLDAIIDKFMDYARPGDTRLSPTPLAAVVEREASAFRDPTQIRIRSRIPLDIKVLADDTELGRVFSNLFENARRYGRSHDTGIAKVLVSHVITGKWVIITVRDQGPGVAPEKLGQLTTPFFRGDAARTAATGAGLGLAIVEKSLQRMGGGLELSNSLEGGLAAHIRIRQAF